MKIFIYQAYTISKSWLLSNHFICHCYFFENQYCLYVFYDLNNKLSYFYNVGNIFLTTYFIEWLDLIINSDNLLEIMCINNFSVNSFVNFSFDSLMWLYILPISTYKSKYFWKSSLISISSLCLEKYKSVL